MSEEAPLGSYHVNVMNDDCLMKAWGHLTCSFFGFSKLDVLEAIGGTSVN